MCTLHRLASYYKSKTMTQTMPRPLKYSSFYCVSELFTRPYQNANNEKSKYIYIISHDLHATRLDKKRSNELALLRRNRSICTRKI